MDASPNLPDVLNDIEGELRILAPSHSDKVTEMLEGWWLKVVAKRIGWRGNDADSAAGHPQEGA